MAGDHLLGAGISTTMIYQDPPSGKTVNWLGAHSPSMPSEIPQQFPPSQSMQDPEGPVTYHSALPLQNVVAAEVFVDDAWQTCRGILIRYQNGGLRAVGQCRVGVDASKEYAHPLQICWRNTVHFLKNTTREVCTVDVHFHADFESTHSGTSDQWSCHPLSGVLQFSFSQHSSTLSICT